jgi:hypothetical protein
VYEKSTTGVEVYNLPLAFLAALVVNVVVSLVAPPVEPELRAASERPECSAS